MISDLRLENFKCFESLQLQTVPLTLLTGFNAAGKSTALQTLLLLAQTLRTHGRGTQLRLNGPLVNLGSPGDVLNQTGGSSQMCLGISTESVKMSWRFGIDETEQRKSLSVAELLIHSDGPKLTIAGSELLGLTPHGIDSPIVEQALEQLRRTVFLSAARQVDADVFPAPQDTDTLLSG